MTWHSIFIPMGRISCGEVKLVVVDLTWPQLAYLKKKHSKSKCEIIIIIIIIFT